MTQNRFDQASRYLAKLDPEGLLAWLFSPNERPVEFRGWLDTRTLPFPGDPERTCDTVAWVWHRESTEDWAVPVEFNQVPDAKMFGRLLLYLGLLWLEQRPSQEQPTRFNVGAVVVNLTGNGQTGRNMELGPIHTRLQVLERNLAQESAEATLDEIISGHSARSLLPWIPLMRGGADFGILERWKNAALAEADAIRRADLGGLALVFADAANRLPIWEEALKEWKMVESKVVAEWMNQAEIKTKKRYLLRLLEKRFPPGLPADLVATIESSTDVDRLSQWFDAAIDAASLAEFGKLLRA